MARGRHISELTGAEAFRDLLPYYERALRGETVSYESAGAAGSQSGYFRFSYRPSIDEHGNIRGILSTAYFGAPPRRTRARSQANRAAALE